MTGVIRRIDTGRLRTFNSAVHLTDQYSTGKNFMPDTHARPQAPETLTMWPVAAAAAALCAWAPPVAATDPSTLQTVTIVGESAARPSFDVPASMDVVEGARIREQQPQVNLSEALSRVPGLVIQNRQNYAQDLQVSSRGFGARASFGVRGVRLVQDGIPLTMPDGQGQPALFDLEGVSHVEVLRGPFAALFGNASGGVIHLTTETAAARPTSSLSAWAGADDSTRLAWRVGGTAGAWALAANVSRFSTDGFREHSAARRDIGNLRLRGPLGDATRLTLMANVLEQPDTLDPLGLTRAQLASDREQAGTNALAYDTRKSVRHRQFGAALQHRLGPGSDLTLSAYGGTRMLEQYLSIPIAFQGPTSSGGVVGLDREFAGLAGQWRFQAQFAGRPLRATVGLTGDTMRERRTGHVNDFGLRGELRRDEINRVRSEDAFALAESQWTESVSVSAGLRHSTVAFDTDDRFVSDVNPDDSGSVRYRRTVPVAGIRWSPHRQWQFHAAAGAGFETPTAAELAYRSGGGSGLNLALSPSRSRNLEAGVKARSGGGATFNAALFRADTRDDIVSAGASGGRTVFANAGRTRRQGLELSAEAAVTEDLAAYLAFTHVHARYRSLTTATGADLSGRRMPGIPARVLHAELTWAPLGSPWSSTLEWHASSRIAVNDANDEAAPGHGVVHWRAGWSGRLGGWQAAAFVRVDNLLDKQHVGSVIVNESNRRYYEPAPGRNASAGVRLTLPF
jgi:iron complex outermembrane receptor protein